MKRTRTDGWLGWIGLTAYVVIWDVVAQRTHGQTLTQAWRNGLAKHRILAVLLWILGGIVGAHLFFPPDKWAKFDLIHRVGRLVPEPK